MENRQTEEATGATGRPDGHVREDSGLDESGRVEMERSGNIQDVLWE